MGYYHANPPEIADASVGRAHVHLPLRSAPECSEIGARTVEAVGHRHRYPRVTSADRRSRREGTLPVKVPLGPDDATRSRRNLNRSGKTHPLADTDLYSFAIVGLERY